MFRPPPAVPARVNEGAREGEGEGEGEKGRE